eukprot:CAMPEP_0182886524 /NCGR_PEP_ID=MMETSP0034_2-20130328/20272_1 /TAXON_ID=156128 /ORGANISM="Nephroselmis pyriformis, Strain CCMP717" /LENGTH=70 /DNA_ID=CAMNT_0025019853 /DNA_START=311 /DNA_END=523 /DNA_ORIENTATION=-
MSDLRSTCAAITSPSSSSSSATTEVIKGTQIPDGIIVLLSQTYAQTTFDDMVLEDQRDRQARVTVTADKL